MRSPPGHLRCNASLTPRSRAGNPAGVFFVPTPVYLPQSRKAQAATVGTERADVTPRMLTFSDEDVLDISAERSTRVASRLCSFVCRLEQHLGWRAGRQTSRCTDERPRLLAGKRKHVDEGLSTASEVPSLGPLHKQQIIFLSLMIRNYTNDGDGSPSFRTFDVLHARWPGAISPGSSHLRIWKMFCSELSLMLKFS